MRQHQERIEAARSLATEQGIAHLVATSTFHRGLWLLRHGQEQEGNAQVQQGLTAYRAMGARLELPHMLAQLAETYGSLGQSSAGLSILAEALALVETTGERWWEVELYRLQGELLTNGVSRLQTNEPNSTCRPSCHGHTLPPRWSKACHPARSGGVYDHHHRVYHGPILSGR
jgi:predicted ATPase